MNDKDDDQTYEDLVRRYFPDATDDEVGFILWEKTCFPFGTAEHIEEQILEFKASRENHSS